MARPNFARELVSWTLLPIMLGGIESGTVAVVVKKTFSGVDGISPQMLNFAVAIFASAKVGGLLTSFLWARAGHGRPKVRFISQLQLSVAVLVASIAVVPRSPVGLLLLMVLTILSWAIWSGITTLRASVWRANFSSAYRAKATARFSTANALATAGTGALIGATLDWNPAAFRWLFPMLAMVGLVGIGVYRTIRFRGQNRMLRQERLGSVRERPSFNPLKSIPVLADDHDFRNYTICMFMLGIGNLMVHAPLAIILNDVFCVSYLQGIAVTSVIPLVALTLTIPFWGRLLDGLHVTQFRAYHGWIFVMTSLLTWWGTTTGQLWVLFVSATMLGIGYGGGALAWNLGHQHFAPAHRDSQYMGVHVTLTGIRGSIGPIFSVALYQYLDRFDAGGHVFAVCAVFNIAGTIGFCWLAYRMRRRKD